MVYSIIIGIAFDDRAITITNSFKYLTKKYDSMNNTYIYGCNNINRSIDAGFIVELYID